MLQVDAKKRITIKDLLVHPWLMEGYEKPVKWQSKYHDKDLELTIIDEIAAYKMVTPNSISERLKRWDYDYLTATYMLMFEKRQKGQSFKLTPGNSPLAAMAGPGDLVTPKRNLLKDIENNQGSSSSSNNAGSPKPTLADSPRGLHNSLEGGLDDVELLKMGNNTPKSKDQDLGRSAKNRASERYPTPNKKAMKEDKENARWV